MPAPPLIATDQPLRKKEKKKLGPLRVIDVDVLVKEYTASTLSATIKIPISDLARLCPSILNAQLAYLYNICDRVDEAIVIEESRGPPRQVRPGDQGNFRQALAAFREGD